MTMDIDDRLETVERRIVLAVKLQERGQQCAAVDVAKLLGDGVHAAQQQGLSVEFWGLAVGAADLLARQDALAKQSIQRRLDRV